MRPARRMISLGFEDTTDAPGRPALAANLDLVDATELAITIGRVDWLAFPWEGHEHAWAPIVVETGRDFMAETIATLGPGRRVTAVIDVMVERWICRDPSIAGIAADGTASTEFASLTALTRGAVGEALLALAEEACTRWARAGDGVAALGLTELFLDTWTFGDDDRGSYLEHRARTGAPAHDWPRTHAGAIDETHPSIGAWRADAVTGFVARVAAVAASHGLALEVEVRAQWHGPTNRDGQDYASLLGVADRLVVWAYFALAGQEPSAVEALVRSLPGGDPARYVVSIGMWARPVDGAARELSAVQLRRGLEAAARGGAVASTVVPASLLDQEHWQELRVLWNPPR
jgi:hypothetical protein